ncbi:Ribosomal protein arginine N-methyltransferase rmt3 [Exophiala xenobiotica]|uniref:type I protein arginine methyltransferase n=1 Tax=Lithohypha guttulata TaxID=1690604 RepID=A0ABR0KG26_9EURO|nr:Ribosomal protein arginine N-methyltransferase rmt3 [Lithohypha guttulata]KAK5322987.1 Ribosomal protein arginine N-methyltransferase rmt3 [Exophiala xenobiotica]
MSPQQDPINPELASSSDEDFDDVDANGWEDIDGDAVPETFVSLFDNETFDTVVAMFEHCKVKYEFDIWKLQRENDLDFMGLVKLVNYVRRSVSQGNTVPDLSKSRYEDDYYLLPAMESDAVLYNLEDILAQSRTTATSKVEELQEQMTALQARFDAYREDVSKYLGDKFEKLGIDVHESSNGEPVDLKSNMKSRVDQQDADYFQSYSGNAIHETMLKDRIRTDAYRDFIYDNKDLFRDKVVLDVIAVDNSHIIDTARDIVKANQLDHKIQCVRGKIEEVQLPVAQVDIIVSEWMGYVLLYESMLDSVIRARDKYLAPGGLMVPSHASLKIGLLADSDLRESHIDFWNDVYGFNMRSMIDRTKEECLIRLVDHDLCGKAETFKVFDLHKVSVQELSFDSDFSIQTDAMCKNLDGFVLWFDIFFARSPSTEKENLEVETAKSRGITSFSTGPDNESTHWQQGICFTEPSNIALNGQPVQGNVTFAKWAKDARGLNIKMQWAVGNSQPLTQSWHID